MGLFLGTQWSHVCDVTFMCKHLTIFRQNYLFELLLQTWQSQVTFGIQGHHFYTHIYMPLLSPFANDYVITGLFVLLMEHWDSSVWQNYHQMSQICQNTVMLTIITQTHSSPKLSVEVLKVIYKVAGEAIVLCSQSYTPTGENLVNWIVSLECSDIILTLRQVGVNNRRTRRFNLTNTHHLLMALLWRRQSCIESS